MKYLLLAACSFLLACGNSDDDQGEVTIYFNHTVAGADLKHEEILYTNAAGNEYGVTRLEYIISDIALETTGGKRVELAEFHYRNAFIGATHSVAAKVSGGEYAALRFTFGRFQTLEEVVEHYDSGFHRIVLTDPLLLVRPNLDLIPADKRAIVAFLKTLSDPQLQAP